MLQMFKNKNIFYINALLLINCAQANVLFSDYIFAKFGEKVVEQAPQQEDPLNQKFTFFSPEFFDPKLQVLSERDCCESAFSIGNKNSLSIEQSPVVDPTFIKKMEVVIGDENKQSSLLLNHFDKHLHTAFGVKTTIQTLSNPICDIKKLHNRQTIIKELIENETLLDELDQALEQMGILEKQLISFWSKTPPINKNVFQMLYFNLPGLKHLNKSSLALEASWAQNHLLPALFCSLPVTIPAFLIRTIMKSEDVGLTEAIKLFGQGTVEAVKATPETLKYVASNITAKQTFFGVYGTFMIGFAGTTMYKMLSTQNSATKHIQQILIDAATYITTAQEINEIINTNKAIIVIQELAELVTFGRTTETSNKLDNLIANLNTNTFKGKPSFFSYSGRTLATYTKMQEIKDELIPLFEAIGTLDMYVAVAKLYKEHQNKKNGFCFAEFVNNETPILEADGFWNPFINSDVVVANDAHLGGKIPNVILTGPNECGKSTILKGLTFNVLLAQTFGIAPAKALRLTLFAKINCYLNITDDTSAGKSLFRAQVELSKKLIDELKNMTLDQFIFTIMDELFTGTSAHEGEEAAYIYAKKLKDFNNSITIIATHFDKLKDLEKTTKGRYINLQVEAIREEDNTITRTFKMKSGFSTMNIAFDILAEAGVI